MKKNKERTLLDTIKRFIEPYFKNKKTVLKSLVFYSFWATTPILHVYFAQKVVEAIETKNNELFIKILVFYVVYLIFNYGAMFLIRSWGTASNVSAFRKTIHNFYLKKFIKLSNTQTEKMGTGKLISIIGTGMDTQTLLLDKILEHSLKILFTLVFTIYTIYLVDFKIAIVFLILYILIHIIGEYFNKKARYYRRRRQDVWNSYTGHIVKIIMSKFEILQTGKIDRELKQVNKYNKNLLKESLKMVTPNYFFFYVPSIFINIIKILMFGILGYLVILGDYPMSFFVAMFGILTLMNQIIINSMIFYSELTNSFTKVEKMWDFFDETDDIKGYDDGKDFEYKNGNIKLEKISFSYSKKNKVFNNFDLDIKGGKITALVGNSGSGKSTLVKLISGYIKPDSGKIFVDGQDLEKVNLKSYYKNIGYLTQEPSVFDGTILENLMYGAQTSPQPSPLEEREFKKYLDEAIKKARCEFIYDLEDGINTEIGEKGIRLSGGQRQRLAIAKIFLKDPKIIILDEPTSALDSFSEEQITKSLNNLFIGRTVIIIAHRLQTVKNADEIFVLEDGEIKERGNHKELIKQKGIYKKMLDLQSGF